jgi:hypothetical protein
MTPNSVNAAIQGQILVSHHTVSRALTRSRRITHLDNLTRISSYLRYSKLKEDQ